MHKQTVIEHVELPLRTDWLALWTQHTARDSNHRTRGCCRGVGCVCALRSLNNGPDWPAVPGTMNTAQRSK